jgi:hypothetical protein
MISLHTSSLLDVLEVAKNGMENTYKAEHLR